MIVGVDPGITAAVACLDLNGNIVRIESGKKLGFNKIVEIISEVGRPIVFSTDVTHLPELIKKLASKYRSKIILPNRNLKVGEKIKIVKDNFGDLKLENDHQRDALASAIFAYEKFKPLFNKIEKVLTKEGKENEIEIVKKKLVLGEAASIKDALKKKEIPEEYRELNYEQKREEKIIKLKNEVNELNKIISKLKEENKKLKNKKTVVEDKKLLNLLNKKEKTIIELNEEILDYQLKIKNLEDKINDLNLKMKYIMKGFIPVVRLNNPKEILELKDDCYGHAVILKEYSKLGKKIKEKIKELNLKLTKGKTMKVGDLEFLIESGDVVEKIQKIIDDWRKRNY